MFPLEHCSVLLSLGHLQVRSDEHICVSAHLPDSFLPLPPPSTPGHLYCFPLSYIRILFLENLIG